MTTPTGSPPWLRTTSYVDYGGDANKTDYLGIGIINPKTDVSAAQLQRMANDLAACARAVPACTIAYTCNDTAVGHPTVTLCRGMAWNYAGAGYTGDRPPTGYPTVTRAADGDNTITFDSTYTDSYGVSGAFAINAAAPSVASIGNYTADHVRTATTVRVVTKVGNTGAAALDLLVVVNIW